MTKNAAIQAFFEGFNLDAYPSASVPSTAETPYLTYDAPISAEMDKAMITASLWYRSDSWVEVNAKSTEISRAVGHCRVLSCDEGAIIFRRGSPFSQPMAAEKDDKIKRNILIFDVTYATTN